MTPRASTVEEQGLSEAVAARIEAPQRGSIRSVYEASRPFLQVVHHSSGELRGTPCKVSCWLPYVPVSGQEVAAQHH